MRVPPSVRTFVLKSLTYGHERVDDDDELRAVGDGDVEVRRRDDAAVDELAVAHRDRRVDHRQRGRRAHGGRDRDVVPALGAEDDPLAGVEVGRGDVQLGLDGAKVVAARRVAREHLVQVALDAGAGVRARGQPLGEPEHEVHRRDLAEMAGDAAQQLGRAQRQREGAAREAADVRPQEVAEVELGKRRRALVVDDAHHLLRRHAVGDHRGHERARARADVDVEVVDGAVDRQQVERAQGADLVDAAGEPAAAEHERRLGALAPRPGLRARSLRRLELDDVAHRRILRPVGPGIRTSGASPTVACCCVPGMRRLIATLLALAAMLAGAAPAAAISESGLKSVIAREMRKAPAASGAYVRDMRHRRASSTRLRENARPHPGLRREALHDVGGAAAPRAVRDADDAGGDRARRRRRARRDAARRPRARRRRRPVLRRRVRRPARQGHRGHGHPPHRGLGRRRRERLRRPALGLLQRL